MGVAGAVDAAPLRRGPAQALAAVESNGHSYLEAAQSITVGYTLNKQLGAFTEWYAIYSAGTVTAGVTTQHDFDGGFRFKMTDNLQFDLRGGVGLNRAADDYFVGAGFAVRR